MTSVDFAVVLEGLCRTLQGLDGEAKSLKVSGKQLWLILVAGCDVRWQRDQGPKGRARARSLGLERVLEQ